MRIILDIYRGEDGRPTGTVRAASQRDVVTFSGNLELLAIVERLYDSETDPEIGKDNNLKGTLQ